MYELMQQELTVLIDCAREVTGYDKDELDLVRESFFAFKRRAEHYMNLWTYHATLGPGFARLLNEANRWIDQL